MEGRAKNPCYRSFKEGRLETRAKNWPLYECWLDFTAIFAVDTANLGLL